MNVPVRIDMSAFFEDERRKVLLISNPKWYSIECLQKRVQNIFGLDAVHFLNQDDCWLVPDERIEILEFCTELKAFLPPSTEPKKKNKKRTKERAERTETAAECTETSDNIETPKGSNESKRKYKTLDEEFASPVAVKLKRPKRRKTDLTSLSLKNAEPANKSFEISSTSEPMTVVTKTQEQFVDTSANETEADVRSPKEKKQKTKSARAKAFQSSTLLNASQTPERHQASNDSKNAFSRSSAGSKHLFFNESGDISNATITNDKKPDKPPVVPSKVIFICSLDEVEQKKPRIFTVANSRAPKADVVEIQENIKLDNLNIADILQKSKAQGEQKLIGPVLPPQASTEIDNDYNCTSVSSGQDVDNKDALEGSAPESAVADSAVSANETANTPTPANEQTNINESSVMSVDCVDLSGEADSCAKDASTIHNRSPAKPDAERSDYDSSEVEEISDLIELNESEEDNKSKSIRSHVTKTDVKIANILPFCKPLISPPVRGNVIVFKVPYRSRVGPQCTGFMAGEVCTVNRRTKIIKILIKDGFNEARKVPDHFFVKLDNSQCGDVYIQLKTQDMKEPKMYKPKIYS